MIYLFLAKKEQPVPWDDCSKTPHNRGNFCRAFEGVINRPAGLVGSGRVGSGRVGSGRVRRFPCMTRRAGSP